MPLNKHHALGLAPFKKAGCSKAIHSVHEYVEFHLENGRIKRLPISIISNALDNVTLEIIPPPDYQHNIDKNAADFIIPETNKVRLNETTLNHALTAHEMGSHSSFTTDYHLCCSGQALNMPIFPKLHIDCPICHAHKINRSIPLPGGATKTKTSMQVDRNKVAIANQNDNDNSNNQHDLKKIINTKEIKRFKSLLLSRMKLRVPLKTDEHLCPPGALIHADFAFCNVTSARGYKSVLDTICMLSRYLFHFLRRSKRAPLDAFQHFIDVAKKDGYAVYRVRIDEDGALSNHAYLINYY